MKIKKEDYSKMVKKASPPSPIFKNSIWAFFVGGAICAFGQFLCNTYKGLGMTVVDARALVSVTLIFLTAVLTAVGLFDIIAKHAGAGTVVPITGFANSVVSAAIEFKSEGFVLGVGSKIFVIAGPVILYGVIASVLYGIVLSIMSMF